jgi:hypothetical protein
MCSTSFTAAESFPAMVFHFCQVNSQGLDHFSYRILKALFQAGNA